MRRSCPRAGPRAKGESSKRELHAVEEVRVRCSGNCIGRTRFRRNPRRARGAARRRHPCRVPPGLRAAAKGGDIPRSFNAPRVEFQYVRREVDDPDARRGQALHRADHPARGVASPRSCSTARLIRPTRRPCAAASVRWPENILSPLYAELVRAGYIVAVEDVRGKYKSEGDYVMNRPLSGPLNPTAVDHSTDAYDTIDWLVKNVPEVQRPGRHHRHQLRRLHRADEPGRTRTRRSRPAVPINPMVDVWKGDDWFHNGAFRQEMISYVYGQTANKKSDEDWFSVGLRRLRHLPPLRFGRRLRPGDGHGAAAVLAPPDPAPGL